ncbi:glycosyltransferase family 4 protein [Achromobacter xylosoxidans]
MASTNIHIYPSPLTHESRILRITDALAKAGIFNQIEVYGVSAPGLPDRQPIDAKRTFLRYPRKLFGSSNGFVAKVIKTVEWSARILASLRGRKIACINAHSLAVLPLCYVASRMTGARLIYDTHELETETTGYKGVRQKLGRLIEKRLIKRCDDVFVVSDAIADWYAERYGIARPHVTRNIPQFSAVASAPSAQADLREKMGVTPDDLLFVYQGGFIAGRGIERLLSVFAQMPASIHLMCMGSGPLHDQIVAAAAAHPNIHLPPPVAPQEVLGYTKAADVGICLTDNSCLSHYYSLPNKVFEYLHAGLPIIVNPLQEQQGIIEQHQCGWVAPEDDAALAKMLRGITRETLIDRQAGVKQAAITFDWHNEAANLVQRYRSLNFG